MSFDAGALTFKLQTTGAQVFRQEVTQADRDLERLGKTAQTTATGVGQTGQATERAGGAARDARGRFVAQADATRQIGDESSRAAPQVQTLGQRVKATEGEMRTVGATFMGVGAALASATALTAKAAIDWESAWAGVTKTVDGTPEQMEEIEDGLRGLARELPSSHAEIAAVAEAAGQLGVKTADVVAFTKTMIDLGETTNLSADQAATSLAQFMNIMGTTGKDVGRLGATIVALGNDGASTEAEIVSMSQRIAGAGALVGATEGEVLALSNALASMGVTAELGGGVASRILQDLYSAVQTGGDKLDGFAKVAGVSAKDFAAAFKDDPVRAMGLFAGGLNGVEKSGGNVVQTLSDLGFKSTEEQRVLLQLKSGTDLLTDSLDLQKKAWDDNNALTEEAAKRYDTVESKIQMTVNSIVDAAISFGQFLLPAIEQSTDVVRDLADGFGNLPEPVKAIVVLVGSLAGVLGLAGGAILLMIPKIVELHVALGVLAASGMPGVSRAAGVMQTATTKAGTALGSMATFLKGPWGLAFIAAAVVVAGLNNEIQKGQPVAAELDNALKTAAGSAALLRTATERSGTEQFFMGDYADSLKEINALLEKRSGDGFLDFLNLTGNQRGALDSLSKIGDQLGALASSDLSAAQDGFADLAKELGVTEKNMFALLDSMPAYRDALTEEATARGINLEGLSDEAKKRELIKLAMGNGAKASESAADAYLKEADAATALLDQLTELIDVINEQNNLEQDAVSSNADYRDAMAGISEEVAAQKKAFEDAGGAASDFTLSLDEATAAGSANAAALSDVAAKAQDAALAQYEVDKTTLGAKEATEKYVATLAGNRQAFIDAAVAAGYNADEVQKLADKVYGLPSEKEIKILAATAAASAQIEEFVRQQQARTISINVRATLPDLNGSASGGGRPGTFADGGIVEFFGRGGIREQHVAQIAAAGSMRVWAEPETGGEAYIPLSPAKRTRSMAILEDVATHFGARVIPRGAARFADGGVTRSVGGVDLTGMQIRGTLDLGNGLTGVINAVVEDALGRENATREAGWRDF